MAAMVFALAGADPVRAPRLALVTTTVGSDASSWWLADDHGALQRLGSFAHLPAGDVRAVVLAGRTLLATAPSRHSRDNSFDTGLWRLDPTGSSRLLCEHLTHASTPLVHRGRAFVVRGSAGASRAHRGEIRIDALRVDEIDPNDGSSTTLHDFDGYMLHLAGAFGRELLLYRVAPNHADIVAIHLGNHTLRPIVDQLPPFARDFSVDRANARLIYRGRHERQTRTWVVDAVSLDSGKRTRLFRGPTFALAPHAWPDGVALNPQRRGLKLIGSSDRIRAPWGDGVDVVRSISPNQRFVAALHTVAGQLPFAFVLDRQGGSVRMVTPAGSRIAIAGFVAEGSP